jgi:hypothetical protein
MVATALAPGVVMFAARRELPSYPTPRVRAPARHITAPFIADDPALMRRNNALIRAWLDQDDAAIDAGELTEAGRGKAIASLNLSMRRRPPSC